MAVATAPLYAWNRGLISRLGLARTDLKRQALSAAQMTNWMPRMLGSMMLRPGFGFIGTTLNNAKAKHLAFVFATNDTAIVELTDSNMRVRVNDTIIVRGAVFSQTANGNFISDLSSWVTGDEPGATSVWAAGSVMVLTGTGFNAAVRFQTVSVAAGDLNKEHAIRIVVVQETISLRVGANTSDDSYINETTLSPGTHSLALVPTGDFVIRVSNSNNIGSVVKSIVIEGPGDMILPTPWGVGDLANIRYDQSADVIFVACNGFQQRKIERRGIRSWSVVLYQTSDGPFMLENTGPIELTPTATTGAISLFASKPLFRAGHVGTLFKIASVGQHAEILASGTNQFSSPIQLKGLTADRNIAITISGAFAGTVILQRSVSEPGDWEDVPGESWTGPVTVNYNDGLDNQIIFYRIGIETLFGSGTADCALDVTTGSITGVCRVTSVVNQFQVTANVLTLPGDTGILGGLGSTLASPDWWEGAWSDVRGWPTAVSFYEGRLWWFGKGKIYGSVSDAFASFDDTVTGDSGPINRTVGSGPVDIINWALPLQRLLLGGQGAEISIRSSSLDEPLTPTNFNLKFSSTQGSMAAAALKIDNNGVFLDRAQHRVYQLNYNYTLDGIDYTCSDLTNFVPDIAISPGGFVMIAVQRKPDTRIHAIMADGTVAVMIYDPNEEEHAWVLAETGGAAPVPDLDITDESGDPIVDETGAHIVSADAMSGATSGIVEDVVILPGLIEDQVYYTVNRTINGVQVRCFEKWAREDECWGGTICKLADSHIVITGNTSTTVQAPHLLNQKVVVWADGKDIGTNDDGTLIYTTDGAGNITLPQIYGSIVIGLFYDAHFMSTKLAYAAQLGTALTQRKRVANIGFILANAHARGIQFGKDFDNLRDLPGIDKGISIDQDFIWTDYDSDMKPFPGNWDTDSRICLYAKAPRPVTVLAAVIDLETRERT